MPFVEAMRTGNHLRFQAALDANEKWLFSRGIFLTLLFRLRPMVWRALSRRTFLLTYIAPTEADSRKAATLELSHLLTTATFVQKRLEGYLPAHPGRKPRQPHINSMFLKAVRNSAAGLDEHSTLAPPPGGPKILRPNEGLVWGNMPVTEDHIENIVASLVSQGLLHGFIAHTQGRFAIIGAKQKGAVAAGWPMPAELLAVGLKEGEDVPGWVKRV